MVYTIQLDSLKVQILIDKYKEFEKPITNEYQKFNAKIDKDTLTIFNTNKVVIQGSNPTSLYNFVCDMFGMEKEIKEVNSIKHESNLSSVIGTDEVGTGDFFGPIVVSACFVPFADQLKLKKMGIKDSKKLSEVKILELGEFLIKNYPNASVILNNEQYNDLNNNKGMNMNKIKALLHNRAINNILEKNITCDKIIIDDFCGREKYFEYLAESSKVIENVALVQKADDKYIAVSCASIIARYHFIKAFKRLSEECGYPLPKGAGEPVNKMLAIIKKEQGEQFLTKIAKINFKTMGRK